MFFLSQMLKYGAPQLFPDHHISKGIIINFEKTHLLLRALRPGTAGHIYLILILWDVILYDF